MIHEKELKRSVARKCLWGGLSIFAVFILVVAVIFIIAKQTCSLKKTETEKTAIKALQLRLGNPEVLKILDISAPDSVFLNRICPEYEVIELSEKFLEYSMNLMKDSQSELRDLESVAYRCKMDRYAESSNTLNTLNNMLEKSEGEHCGWRVKVKYQTKDDSETSYTAESWFIFDKEKKHILNSFDISLL